MQQNIQTESQQCPASSAPPPQSPYPPYPSTPPKNPTSPSQTFKGMKSAASARPSIPRPRLGSCIGRGLRRPVRLGRYVCSQSRPCRSSDSGSVRKWFKTLIFYLRTDRTESRQLPCPPLSYPLRLPTIANIGIHHAASEYPRHRGRVRP